jgi:hypothetical protein
MFNAGAHASASRNRSTTTPTSTTKNPHAACPREVVFKSPGKPIGRLRRDVVRVSGRRPHIHGGLGDVAVAT